VIYFPIFVAEVLATFGEIMNMNKITKWEALSSDVYRFEVEAPQIARKHKAGQFVILRVSEEGERFPLTIADSNASKGTITLIFQAVGKSTKALANHKVGDNILDLVGPLGTPTHVERFGTVVGVGGGIGVAPLYPITKAMKAAGNKVISIIGARTKDLLILEKEMKATSDEVLVSTDDGSYGFHGLVTQVLEQVIARGEKINEVTAIGPVPMMRAVCNVTRKYNLPTIVSLNTIMVDGTGMCGGCRVTVGTETKFTCVDGPEFDGLLVDFDELSKRLKTYRGMEVKSSERYDHECLMRRK
jgi:ferredoxin--NADP+ reductase